MKGRLHTPTVSLKHLAFGQHASEGLDGPGPNPYQTDRAPGQSGSTPVKVVGRKQTTRRAGGSVPGGLRHLTLEPGPWTPQTTHRRAPAGALLRIDTQDVGRVGETYL